MSKTITPIELLDRVQGSIIDAKGETIRALALAYDEDLALDLREVMDRLEDLIQYANRKIGKYQRELA
jgi:hypothetical protein